MRQDKVRNLYIGIGSFPISIKRCDRSTNPCNERWLKGHGQEQCAWKTREERREWLTVGKKAELISIPRGAVGGLFF